MKKTTPEDDQKLLAELQKAKNLFEASSDALVVFDVNLNVLYENRKHKELFNLLSDRACHKALCKEEGSCKGCPMQLTLKDGKTHIEESILKSSKGPVHVEIVTHPLRNAEGMIYAYFKRVRDTTDKKDIQKSLEKSQMSYRALVEDMPAMACRFDKNGKLTFVNKAFAQSLKKSAQSLLGTDFFQFVPKDMRSRVKDAFSLLTKNDPVKTSEIETVCDGKVAWKRWTRRGIFDKRGRIVEYQCIGYDITESKTMQELLKEREARYRALFEDSPISLWELDLSGLKRGLDILKKQGVKDFRSHFEQNQKETQSFVDFMKVVNVNKATLDFYEMKDVNTLKNSLNKVFNKRTYEIFKEEIFALAEGKIPYGAEIFRLDVAGKAKYGLLTWRVAPGYEDTWSKAFVSILNITSLKDIENDLVVSKGQLRNVMNSVNELIVAVNKQGIITTWNKEGTVKTGIPQKEIIGKNIFSNKFPKEAEPLIKLLNLSLKTHKSEILDIEIKDRNMNKHFLIAESSLITDTAGEVGGVVLVGRDVSPQRKVYKRLIPGKSYAYYKKDLLQLRDIFNELVNKNYSCISVSRDNLEWLRNRLACKKVHAVLMTDKRGKGIVTETEPEALISEIKKAIKKNKKSLIFINRLEYISAKYGFNGLLKFVYDLNDLVRFSESIVVAQILDSCFNERELAIIKNEFNTFPILKKDKEHLDEKSLEILKFILANNSRQIRVPFNIVSKRFSLSRPTTKNVISELQKINLVKIEKTGRTKHIYATTKAKELISTF
ncbi:MAG: PAS domain S-box protein [bacterium]|nr:PAS domain S-box protein [bacterium]